MNDLILLSLSFSQGRGGGVNLEAQRGNERGETETVFFVPQSSICQFRRSLAQKEAHEIPPRDQYLRPRSRLSSHMHRDVGYKGFILFANL